MNAQLRIGSITGFACLFLALSAIKAEASVIAVGPGAFPSGSTLITFADLADGTEETGLISSPCAKLRVINERDREF